MDWRNQHDAELERPQSQNELFCWLPFRGPVRVEQKLDGHAASIELRPDAPPVLVSRGRDGATGLFRILELDPWMQDLRSEAACVLHAELVTAGDPRESTAAAVATKGVEHALAVHDLLMVGDRDWRDVPFQDRRRTAGTIVTRLNDKPRVYMIDGWTMPAICTEDVADIESMIPAEGVEGYVVKPLWNLYGEGDVLGWKIKPDDTADGFIVAVREATRTRNGLTLRTGAVGTVEVAQHTGRKNPKRVGWVPIPADDRIPLTRATELTGRVLSFRHQGRDARGRYRSCRFASWRHDKSADQCTP